MGFDSYSPQTQLMLRRTEIRYDSPSDNGNRSSTDDGRRLPAMRD
jgi:hypothetical protein